MSAHAPGTGGPRVAPGSLLELGPVGWCVTRALGLAAGTHPPNLFTTLGKHRSLFRGWLSFASRLMPFGKLPRRETELVILRVAHLRACTYEVAHHEHLGRRAGLGDDDLERVAAGPEAAGWSSRERLLLRATDALHRSQDLPDDLWQELVDTVGEVAAIELVLLVGHYEMLATTIRALRIAPDTRRGG